MKANRVIILLCFLLVLGACVPKPPVSTEPSPAGIEDVLFIDAENFFEAEDYSQALDAYVAYLDQYPDRPLAAAALMKIGKIHSIRGNYDDARRAYNRLISEYPRSSFNPDARVEGLFSFYSEGNYQEVIQQAADVIRSVDSPSHVVRIYALVGDAYMALELPLDAFKYYVEAQQMASESEQFAITQKIKAAIAQLDSEKIQTLLQQYRIKV